MPFTIAIDGPAASGKGTIARAISRRFGFHHLDTGLLYRAVGAKGGDPVAAAQDLHADDLARPDLRTNEAGQAASRVAAIPEVRSALIGFQRRFAMLEPGAVLDGRDIGTVVLPHAQVKIFLTASAEERARRRYKELMEKGEKVEYEKVLAEMKERDYNDSNRASAPLRAAPDAITVDTTELSLDESIEKIKNVIKENL